MAVVGQQLLQPESGWRRYDDNTPLIRCKGVFVTVSNTSYYGGSHQYTITTGSSITFIFLGTKFRLISNIGAIRDNNVKVTIDDDEVFFFDNITTATTGASIYNILVAEKQNLERKIHKVVIEKVSNDTNYVVLDAIDIDADGELIRHDYFDNLPYDEPMRKYGIAHFGFDESSGSVYDKLGSNYVGTVTGATRVQGWDGEGNAIKCSGTGQIVRLPSLGLPQNDYTIKVKIKALPNSNWNYFLGNYSSSSTNDTKKSISFALSSTGHLRITEVQNSSNISQSEDVFIADNTWKQLMVTKDNKSINLYINDIFVSRIDSNHLTENMPFTLLNNDGQLTGAGRWLNGQLDDLQFYSKALTPKDFTQHRVAIKTSDNKNLVLPVREGRVKEIPTATEVDLINQGYTWREIDNAVDGGIDLTQTTTEYEIVSKTNSALGNGKIFTIPINDFKTAKIEDNY